MKAIFLLLLVLSFYGSLNAQKKNLDTTAIHNWPFVDGGGLSPDGQYAFFYELIDNPYLRLQKTLVIKAVHTDWSFSLPDADMIGFDHFPSTKAVLRLKSDTVALLTLGNGKMEYLLNVEQCLCKENFLIYRFKTADTLYMLNIKTGVTVAYAEVKNFFTEDGVDALVIQQRVKEKAYQLSLVDLKSNSTRVFYTGEYVEHLIWEPGKTAIAILCGERGKKQIYYCRKGNAIAKLVLSDNSAKLDSGFQINDILRFSANGKYLLFNITRSPVLKPAAIDSGVTVYSYRDFDLSFEEGYYSGLPASRAFCRALDLGNGRQTELEGSGDGILMDNGKFTITVHRKEGFEWQLFQPGTFTHSLVSLADGKKTAIPGANDFWFSPNGRMLLYFDGDKGAYCVIDLTRPGAAKVLSVENGDNYIYSSEEAKPLKIPIGLAAWANNGNSALIYARDGLWQLDLDGRKAPFLLTRPDSSEKEHRYKVYMPASDLKNGDTLTLLGFNPYNKDGGFYQCIVGHSASSFVLSKGPWAVWIPEAPIDLPVKAEDSGIFMIRKMTAENSPNYYTTSDFREFHPVSNVYPEKDYNWLTAELFHWNSFDGHPLAGVLYKPQDFDPRKKYPVLFYYYEHLSNNLHVFLRPGLANGPLNIPYMVSKGYLIFTPDIDIQIGHPGRSAYNAVVSAAQLIGRLPYVDSLRMGIQGHSWGGFETFYIAAHTRIFAAACSASGISDMVMEYGGFRDNRFLQEPTEEGQCRMGAPLTAAESEYLENSSILDADKMTVPLLILHNWEDKAVDVRQSLAMFGSLRRLGKPAWLLQYAHEGHDLTIEANKVDYTRRLLEFFDHFLMGKPIPLWMR